MIRMSTKVRDEEIIRLFRDGLQPKLIKQALGLGSIWIVYKAVKRFERRKKPRR